MVLGEHSGTSPPFSSVPWSFPEVVEMAMDDVWPETLSIRQEKSGNRNFIVEREILTRMWVFVVRTLCRVSEPRRRMSWSATVTIKDC
jgi:hypothetical protein